MRYIISLLATFSILAHLSSAEGLGQPWDKGRDNPLVLEGPKNLLVVSLATARTRLDENFSATVLEYANENSSLAYWLGALLLQEVDLDADMKLIVDHKIDVLLAIACLDKAVINGRSDRNIRNDFRAKVLITIAYKLLGAHTAASKMAREVNGMAEKEPVLEGSYPALSQNMSKIFDGVLTE